jgi:cyclopropane-fatty-acyl-phospholipid synthase
MSAIARTAQRRAFRALEQIADGALTVATPAGERLVFGGSGPRAEIAIRDWRVVPAVLARGDVGFGEAYLEGWWESPDIEALTALTLRNRHAFDAVVSGSAWSRWGLAFADALLRGNSRAGARRNIKAHYDVGNAFYRLWLDQGLTYSSALYGAGAETLETAQRRKFDRLLSVSSGEGSRTLEIGCGWGGFAERAAEEGREVTAITISAAQHAYAAARLGRRADIRLMDYRDVRGTFDSIVSIEMVEAVGERYWPVYFGAIKQRLNPHGRAAIQAITVEDAFFPAYRRRSDFIRRHVFPGGMLLAPSRIRAEAARAGLVAENLFGFGRDYARTLREWLARFEAAAPAIRKLGYGERFVRCWRFYLASCAGLFEAGKTDVVHAELRHA